MQRDGKNIDELLANFTQSFHRLRQSSINEELFDTADEHGYFSALGGRLWTCQSRASEGDGHQNGH